MLPESLKDPLAAALADMCADPQHHLPPRRRRELYARLAEAGEPALRQARGWLALLTARHVQPLFHQACPDDTLPQTLLDGAAAVLEGRLGAAEAAELEARGYQASRNAWGYAEAELPWPVGLAADAAYHALKEARGYQPLTDLEAYLKLGTVEWPAPGAAAPVPPAAPTEPAPRPAAGERFTDEALCQIDNSDTAAVAAVAWASADYGPTCDPARLEAFWTWWLGEAVPAAIAAAQRADPNSSVTEATP